MNRTALLSLAIILLSIVTMNSHASDKVLFHFTTESDSSAWQIVNDGVMGGVSTSAFRITNGLAIFLGKVSLENNGGFASVRSPRISVNLGGCDAVVVRARGDGRCYKFTLRTESSFDSPIYQAAFTTLPGEWKEFRLPFKDFVPTFRGRILPDEPALDPAKVLSAGFLISERQEGPFQLEMEWIKATRSSDP